MSRPRAATEVATRTGARPERKSLRASSLSRWKRSLDRGKGERRGGEGREKGRRGGRREREGEEKGERRIEQY